MTTRWLPGVDPGADSPLPRPDHGSLDGLRTDVPEADPTFDPPLPWALPACADLLRRAGEELRRLPVAARIAGLDRVARSWLDPTDALRREALDLLPTEAGLSPELVAWGLDRAFEVARANALEAWWEAEGGRSARGPRLSGHVLSGNVFTAGLPPVFASLLAGVPALVKAPAAAPTFAALLARSLALHAPELGPCLAAAAWSRQDARSTEALLASVDALFVFGDDDTVASLRAAARCPVHGFGHRYSVAWLTGRGFRTDEGSPSASPGRHGGPGSGSGAAVLPPSAPLTPSDAAGLAIDVLAWNGAGCLTPRWVFVEGDGERALAQARVFATALAEAAGRLPSGPRSEVAGAARAQWLGVEAAMGWVRSGPGWAVSARASASLEPAPPGRCVAFVPVPHRSDLPALLSGLGRRLQGLALVGTPADAQELRALLDPLGLSRVAAAGRLQVPELAWNHDDVALLPALC